MSTQSSKVTVVRAREPRDLIALVPYRLGFRPQDSVVLVSLRRNARGRFDVGLVIRADTADLADPALGVLRTLDLARHLADDRADDVAVVAYSAAPFAEAAQEGSVLGHALTAVTAALHHLHPDPWLVAADGWGHPGGDACCPVTGRDLAELESSEVGAAMVLEGRSVLSDRAALALVRDASGPRGDEVRRGAEAERVRRRAVVRASGGAPLVRGAAFGVVCAAPAHDQAPLDRWRRDGAVLWDQLVDRPPGELAPADLGRLQVFLADKIVRDAVVARTVGGARRATVAYVDAPDRHLGRDLVRTPRTAAVDAAMELAGAVAAPAPPGKGAPALGILAFLAWWTADGARADTYARQALEEEPGHRLAELVRTSLDNRVPPPWHQIPGQRTRSGRRRDGGIG